MQTFITKREIKNHQTPEFLKPSSTLYLSISFLLCLIPAVIMYGWQSDAGKPIKLSFITAAITCLIILAFRFSFKRLVVIVEKSVSWQKGTGGFINKISKPGFGLLVITLLFSCNSQPLVGVSTDINTGMVTTYSKIKPEEAVLIMNEEKLGHSQIPLGEKFVVVNSNVQGLVVKDNKISVGCSLIISDLDGKELLHEEDLFKDNSGIFEEKDAEYLKCTVSTGKPMEYDKYYNVAVRFWDKYGSGSIDNKIRIEIIDIP